MADFIKMKESSIKTPSKGACGGSCPTGKQGSTTKTGTWFSGHNKGSQDR